MLISQGGQRGCLLACLLLAAYLAELGLASKAGNKWFSSEQKQQQHHQQQQQQHQQRQQHEQQNEQHLEADWQLHRCDPQTEFTCRIGNTCIPIEWQCDFAEQCPDGQDEFGCAPAHCDFKRDLCNFNNELQAPPVVLWRRYRLEGGQASQARLAADSPDDLLAGRLQLLAAGLADNARLLYAPLLLNTELRRERAPDRPAPGQRWLNLSSARLSTPELGQTNSVCQLRFRYALWAQWPASGQARLNLSVLEEPRGAAGPRLAWSRAIEPQAQQGPQEHWYVAVVELGHLRRSRVSLVAEALLESSAAGSAAHVSLVAIEWLDFHECAFPGGQPPPGPQRRALQPPRQPQPPACKPGQFECSTGVCLEQRKLCNFVDDCLTGRPSYAQADDETPQLCQPVLGRQSFEAGAGPGLATNYSSAPQPALANEGQFWFIETNWPQAEVRIATGAGLDSGRPAPARDHTTGRPLGHYLSLEANSSLLAGAKPVGILWFSMRSPVLSTSSLPSSECRLKFYYNIVSNGPHQAEAQLHNLPYHVRLEVQHVKLGLRGSGGRHTIEHFVDSTISTHASELSASGSTAGLSKLRQLEYPGLDFWREANFKIAGLATRDLFYLRLLATVTRSPAFNGNNGQRQTQNQHQHLPEIGSRLTVNLDDFSLHFGCEVAPERDQQLAGKLLLVPFDITPPSPSLGRTTSDLSLRMPRYKRHPEDYSQKPGSERDPQKLIMSVLIVLSIMVGFVVLIVFLVVPYVERVAVRYHDQLASGLSDTFTTTHAESSSRSGNTMDFCELNLEPDWDRLGRHWRHRSPGSSGPGTPHPATHRATNETSSALDDNLDDASHRSQSMGGSIGNALGWTQPEVDLIHNETDTQATSGL